MEDLDMRTNRHNPTYTIDHSAARSFRHSVERAMQNEIKHLREQCSRLASINDQLIQEADEQRRSADRHIRVLEDSLRRSRQDVRQKAAQYAVEYMRSVGRVVTVEEVLGVVSDGSKI